MQRMTSSNPSTELFSDSGQKCHESARTDSGFLSGANLVSEENLSFEDSPTGLPAANVEPFESERTSSQLDSGLDLGLNKQFSGLTLHQHKQELSESGKSKLFISKSDCPGSRADNNLQEAIIQPWELYFQQDEEGDNQLHIAIIQGFVEVAYSLIKMVPHPCFLDIHNDVIQAPLHLAVLTHQARIVRRLVVAGASVEARDRWGNTPLHLACRLGDLECVKSLTEPVSVSEAGKAGLVHSRCPQQVPQDFEERNYDGETCLHLAAYHGHMDVLRHLIWFGADINAREDKSGKTVLHYAVETLDRKLLRFLLDECSFGPNGLAIDTRNYAGHTPYQLARLLDANVAEELASRGARPWLEDIDEDEDDHPDHNASDDEEVSDVGDTDFGREALPVQ